MIFGQVMEISTLSDRECVLLVATYNDACDGEKNRLAPSLNNRGYTAAQLAQATTGMVEKFNPFESCGLRFTRPFGDLKYEQFEYVLRLFENYDRGCLPFPGSVSEQPSQIIEIFSVLKQLKYEQELKIRQASKR